METKEYVVALDEGIDYDQFWLDMENVTSGLPHIPDRAVGITNNRTAFKRLCEYALTDDEADRVRNDPRVVGIEIPVRNNPNVSIVHDAVMTGKNFTKPTASTGNEVNWGLIRHSYPTNNYGTTDTTYKTTSKEYTYTLDGTGVDVVINDSGMQVDHPEFTGRVPYVDWDLHKPGGTVNITAISRQDTGGHGTHVAGIAAGTTYGWAKGSNVIPLSSRYNDFDGNGEPLDVFETLINWHRSKNGSRPTVVNMSWALRYNWKIPSESGYLGDYRNFITGGVYRKETTILAGQTANNNEYYKKLGLIDLLQGLPLQDRGTPVYLPFNSQAYNTALGEVIDAGIIVVQSAGNNNFKQDKPDNDGGSGDYDNYFNIVVPALSWNGQVYYHRGASPRDPRSIVVGNLSDVQFYGKEWKATSSTKGPRIDVWAAGSKIMSSCSTTNEFNAQPYQHGTPSENAQFKQVSIDGTSMASPQIAGMCALYLQKHPTATPADVKKWIKDTSIKGLLQDNGRGAHDAYADGYSLLGGTAGIAYQNLQGLTKSFIKDNTNTWRQTKAVWVKHTDGTWKQAKSGWKKNNAGAWEKIYES